MCIFQAISNEWMEWANGNEKEAIPNKDVVSFVTRKKKHVTMCFNSTKIASYVIGSETVCVLLIKSVTLPRSIRMAPPCSYQQFLASSEWDTVNS